MTDELKPDAFEAALAASAEEIATPAEEVIETPVADVIVDDLALASDEDGDIVVFEVKKERHDPVAEINMLNSVYSSPIIANGVLSTGGGAFLSAANRSLIHDVGVSVWLRADLDLLWQRVRHKATRPLLRTENPRETLRQLYEARVPLYAMADITVDSAADLSVEDMATKVVAALAARPQVLAKE